MARKIHFSDEYQPDFGLPWVPLLPRARLEQMSMQELVAYEQLRKDCDMRAELNPVGSGWTMPAWSEVMANWKKYSIHVVLGGNQCVHGDTAILDPVTGRFAPISARTKDFHVWAWDGSNLTEAKASKAFRKGVEPMIKVSWSWGLGHPEDRSITCTRKHKFMRPDGSWVYAGELVVGDQLLAPWHEGLTTDVTSIADAGTHEVWDITVPDYGNYWCGGVIHSNSGKTTLGARMSVWAAATIPEAETYCFHVSEKRSIDDQQRFIYEALPMSVKNMPTKKGQSFSLQYSQKNGFTDSICILPPHQGYRRGGSINFFNYAQYQQNDQIIEGIKAHFVWADEKIPMALMETLKYRLFTYHGRLLLTYTVIDGWNDTIEKILAKTRTLKKKFIHRLNMEVPVIQESLSMDSCCIYYAHTDDNPFTDAKEFWKLNATADRATILARAYGVPTKSMTGVFPAFSREVNVVPHDKLPWIKDPEYKVTRYMAIDPAGSKNWFMAWVAIDASGTWWVYREWPDNDDWALPGNKPGPAQKGSRKGIKDYVELIRDLEGDERIFERFIDPRLGAAEKQSQEGATTIISDLDDNDMIVIPAPGVEIENGLQLINNLLAWDDSKPRDSVNSPRFFVSDRCQNIIYAMTEYTSKLGQTEATKDCIDPLRYLAVSNAEYLEDAKEDRQNRTGVY